MKREIKFRAFIKVGLSGLIINRMDYLSNKQLFEWEEDGVGMKIMQFTGLTDKNDKEIYFGDVLQTPTGIATVVWQDIAVALKSPGSEAVDWEHSSYYAKCEIIGNIHENPELLQ